MARAAKTILLVDDDRARASMTAQLLRQADYRVDGPHGSLSDGIAALAAHFPDGAIIDAGSDRSFDGLLTSDLDLYGIPYILCTSELGPGSNRNEHPAAMLLEHRNIPGQLLAMLSDTLH